MRTGAIPDHSLNKDVMEQPNEDRSSQGPQMVIPWIDNIDNGGVIP